MTSLHALPSGGSSSEFVPSHCPDEEYDRAIELGLVIKQCRQRVHWTIARLVLHRADPDLSKITLDDIEHLREKLRVIDTLPEIGDILDVRKLELAKTSWSTMVFQTGVVLFHSGVIDQMPRRQVRQERLPLSTLPRVLTVMERYVAERSLWDRPASLEQTRQAFRRFSIWLAQERPSAVSLAALRRVDLLDFLIWLQSQRKIKHPEQELSLGYRRMIAWQISAFFRYASHAEWDDVPVRAPLATGDVPRGTFSVPRYIPAHELEPLMEHIRQLDCPLQRCALLVARWSGARRTEIRKLHLDCLDSYPDGTPRLRLAPGKSRKERIVPIHQEAADAIKTLIAIRDQQPDRGVYDAELGRPIRRLFLNNGRLASPDYLFAFPLHHVCAEAGLLDEEGKALVHAHRFRHTLGTQLAEKGAKTLTIMKVLGHASAHMSMIYAHISDPVVLADYQAVIQPGALLAGPQADAIRTGRLDQEALDWLKTNFYKTELELGHCLRLPQEGPCECDIYLTCPKFLTTTKYAPRLRERLCLEQQLTEDAATRGWAREVERHQRTTERLRDLLQELGEPTSPLAQEP